MPKYRCYVDEISHFVSKEIDATDQDEAAELYLTMIDNGEVETYETELGEVMIDTLED